MNTKIVKTVAVGIWKAATKHSPEILTGIGIVGMVATVVMAVNATPKAMRLIEEEKAEKPSEKIKATWKCYIPTVVTGGMSVLCLVGGSAVSLRRNAALGAAYALAQGTMKEYKDKVIETLGEKKERDIHDAIAKDRVQKTPVQNTEVIITERGNTLCYDMLSGRYFKSDADKLRKAIIEINRRMAMGDDCQCLNDFYCEIGLPENGIGNDVGWNINDGRVDLDFSSQLATDGTPCLVVDFSIPPKYNYNYYT